VSGLPADILIRLIFPADSRSAAFEREKQGEAAVLSLQHQSQSAASCSLFKAGSACKNPRIRYILLSVNNIFFFSLINLTDKQYVLKKSPFLIQEMVSIVAQLVAMAHAGRGVC
jgi:hypothetical protein